MTEEAKIEVPPTRPIFTEEESTSKKKRKKAEQGRPSAKLQKELGRLRKLPVVPGKATIGMIGEFKKFP